jgi:RNA polymerase sigma-70 factor, ECF subfamily
MDHDGHELIKDRWRLHRVVVNACLDRLRSMRLRETEPLPKNIDRSRRMGIIINDPVEIKEQRSVVGTVKSRCTRGRARLLPLLDHHRQADS